jgi:hypothetical protein
MRLMSFNSRKLSVFKDEDSVLESLTSNLYIVLIPAGSVLSAQRLQGAKALVAFAVSGV